MEMNSLNKVMINGTAQWVLVRGQKADAPLIIHVQAGPGLPMIPEAKAMEKMLHLEQDYLVAYWDQRGCGKSYDKALDPKAINFQQMADDIISCTRYLLQHYHEQKAILIGYSIGASTALMAAMKESDLFSQLFLVGIDIDLPKANDYALNFLAAKAKESGNAKQIRQAKELSEAPIVETIAFQKRAKLLTDLGGINTKASYNGLVMTSIKNMICSREYRLSDIPKTIKGMEFSQNALLQELNTLNLFAKVKKVNVPVHFIQGKKDGLAPFQIAVDYFNFLEAPAKSFTSFEESAHMPHYEEPDKFVALITEKLTAKN
jgi:pimeloyl-ACP methyl ester carboxylesterase